MSSFRYFSLAYLGHAVSNICHSKPLWVHYNPLLPPCDVTYPLLFPYCFLLGPRPLVSVQKGSNVQQAPLWDFLKKEIRWLFTCSVAMNRFEKRLSLVKCIRLLVWSCDWKINSFGTEGGRKWVKCCWSGKPQESCLLPFWQLLFLSVVFLHHTPSRRL